MNVAEALTTLGRLVGMVTEAVAVVDVSVPLSVVDVTVLPPVCPLTAMRTAVPGGILTPASATVTGFVVDAGSVTSGAVKDAPGAGGVATPPMDVIVSVGPFASATADGGASEGGILLMLTAAVLL